MKKNYVFILAFWLLLFAAITWYFQQQTKPAAIVGAQGELILTQHSDGHFYSEGKINGFPVMFMIDTGATSVSISEQFANEANLQGGIKSSFSTAGGVVEGRTVKNNIIEVGPFKVSGLNVAVLPSKEIQNMATSLLGQNFLRKVALTQHNKQMILRLP